MTQRILLASSALALAMMSLAPSTVAAQRGRPADDLRLSGYFSVQACCEGRLVLLDSDADDNDVEFELDPSVGFGFRVEKPLADYFSLGGMFEMVAWQEDADDDREFLLDLDVFLKVRVALDVSTSFGVEIYGLAPLGFTIGLVDEDDAFFGDTEETGFGLNTGLLGGVALLFGQFGAFAELGFRYHSVWSELDRAGDVRRGITQLAFNVGGSVSF